MTTQTMYIAVAQSPAAITAVSAPTFGQLDWRSAVKPGSHRVDDAARAAMTDATFGLARRPRRIPL
jgi:hypothetical protein